MHNLRGFARLTLRNIALTAHEKGPIARTGPFIIIGFSKRIYVRLRLIRAKPPRLRRPRVAGSGMPISAEGVGMG